MPTPVIILEDTLKGTIKKEVWDGHNLIIVLTLMRSEFVRGYTKFYITNELADKDVKNNVNSLL